MELKDIFKMEMYKNCNDKPYLLVIAILTVMAAVTTFTGIAMLESNFRDAFWFFYPLLIFTILGLSIFSLLYPFHLLNVDYKNKVMSLIFASGVSREKYYFVKVGATILSCLMAMLIIVFIPGVIFLIVYPENFVELMQNFFKEFSIANILPFVLASLFSVLAYMVILTTAVIITKGKVSGIFLFFLFLFGISIFEAPFGAYFLGFSGGITTSFYMRVLFAIVKILLFGSIGLFVLRKQDL